MQFLASLIYAITVVGINDEDKTLGAYNNNAIDKLATESSQSSKR